MLAHANWRNELLPSIYSPILVAFSKLIDKSTITEDTFALRKNGSSDNIVAKEIKENKYCSKCSYPLIPSAFDEIIVLHQSLLYWRMQLH
jgi:hypothetical protein